MQYIGTGRLGTVQNVAYTGTAGVITNPVGSQTYKVRVVATTDCYIRIDAAPVAVVTDTLLPGLSAEYFTIQPGQKVSAIQVSANGSLFVTEIW